MKKYDNYKDSGIHWLGDIPKHWEVKKLKFFANVVLGKMLTSEDKGGYILKPYLRAKNIEWITPNIEDVKEMWFSKNEISQYRIEKSDLLVSEGGEVGRTCIWNNELEECYIQNSVHKVRILNEGTPYYFLYQFLLLGRLGHFDAIVNRISIAHLTKEKLEDVVFISPHISEQTIIAKYLNHKTTQIDNLIQKKERLIELLQEERIALINQAVTKGLDPNAPMKDSGIEWLGEIPRHWGVKKLKYICNLKSGINIVSEQITSTGEYPVYGGNGHRGYYSDYTNEGNYVLIGRQGALCGNINLVTDKFWASEHAIVCYLFENINWIWLGELLRIMNLNQYSQASAQPGLAVEKIKNLSVPVPNEVEQNNIVRFITTEQSRINTVITRTNQEIELLKEYKTALISEVVTGKVDVRSEILN